jgi:hypothetical protein
MKQMMAVIGLAMALSSCARKEPPPVAVEQQQQQQPAAAPVAPVPEPVRETAWHPAPAPVRTVERKAAPMPVAAAPRPAESVEIAAPPVLTAPEPVAGPIAVATKPAVPAPPMQVTLVAGSIVAVRVGETLTSEKNENGDSWTGVLAEPLVIDGLVISERGARVEGRVTDVQRAGRVKGVAQLTVALTRIHTADGQRVNVETARFAAMGKDETKRDVGKVAIAAGIGAAIGAIAGQGKGAAIGAGAGAAAGTGAVLMTRGGPAVIGTEALIRFRIAEAVTITEKLK